MKYDHREIKELDDLELIQAYQNCKVAETRRNAAKNHFKFNKFENKQAIELPPISPLFLEMKNELYTEITNRKLEVEQ